MNNIDLLREQIDLNSDLLSKLERMEIQSEKNHFELCNLNSTNAELNTALNAMSSKMEERGSKLMDISNERDRLSRLLANREDEFAVANFDMNRSMADNKTLRDQLQHKSEELVDAKCNITSSNLTLKEQKMNFEEIISNMKPELEAYKALNERLNTEIAAAGKSMSEQRKDTESLKKHISDLTTALDGFAAKFNNESDMKKIATQKLHESTMAMLELEEEHQRLCLSIEELRGEYDNQGSLLESRRSDKEWLSSELSRVKDERNALKGENEYLKNELEAVQCILADQLQLRLQDRSDYEALLVASAEDVQHAIEDSNDRLEDITKDRIKEAQSAADEAKQHRKEISDRCRRAEEQNESLYRELNAVRAEYERVCKANAMKDRYTMEISNASKEIHQRIEKDNIAKSAELSVKITEFNSVIIENRENADVFVVQLERYQDCIKIMKEDAWNLRSKIKQQDGQISQLRSKFLNNSRLLTDCLRELEADQKAALHCLVKRYLVLQSTHSTALQRAQDESARAMYLTREVTNLKLELFESRRRR